MKKIKRNEKLALTTDTIKTLTAPEIERVAGASQSGCLITSTCYTKNTTYTICV